MTTRRLILFVAAALAVLVATAPQAGACSCAIGDPDERYRDADAAMIGTAVAADDETVTLRVDHEFKVDLPEQIVLANGEESSCGLGLEAGDGNVGLFLRRTKDGWEAGFCDTVDPDDLPGAVERLPRPLGSGTAALLAYGGFSGGRLAALDADGRVLAYGAGRGTAAHVSVCPRSERLVELAYDGRRPTIALRRTRDLAVLRESAPPLGGSLLQVSCRDAEGEDVAVAVDRRRGRDDVIARIVRGRPRIVWRGRMRAAELAGDFAFVDHGKGRGMRAVNVVTGAQWRLRGVRPYTSDWAVSPDGSRAAAITSGSDRPRTGDAALVVVELQGARRTVVRDLQLGWLDASVLWVGDDRILFGGDSNFLRLYDARLRQLRRYASRFEPIKLTLAGGRLYGVGSFKGGLLAADAPDYAERALGELPASGLYRLLAIPGGAAVDVTP